MSEFKVYINYTDYNDTCEVYIFEQMETGRRLITKLGDPPEVLFLPKGSNKIEKIEPTFTLHGLMAKAFFQAFANKLDEIGIRPEGKPILENELTAVKYHLEDMRRLTFQKEE